MNFQWYPGHMTKAKRQMQEDIKLIDLVIELVDARIPLSSRNPDIDELGKNKYRLILMNKADLADRNATEQWSAFFKKKGYYVVSLDARSKNGMKSITDIIMEACKEKMERDRKRGIKNRPVRAMVVGIPNVGKSTLLSRVSNARPKIANYHFTTLNPHLGVVNLGDGNSFVMEDIPGLIEGASEGAGLGHEFLRHIERTKVLLHVVDAASVEGRDPIEDVHAIMDELSAYNPELLKLPQAIAANKLDAVYDEGADPLADLKKEFEPMGIPVFGISAVSGEGVNDLLYYLYDVIRKTDRTPKIFEKEFEIEYVGDRSLPYTVEKDEEGIYVVEGPRIEKMLGYTNLDSEKGFDFFQKFLKQSGILADLEKAGIQEGDTVRMYGLVFDYYK